MKTWMKVILGVLGGFVVVILIMSQIPAGETYQGMQERLKGYCMHGSGRSEWAQSYSTLTLDQYCTLTAFSKTRAAMREDGVQ